MTTPVIRCLKEQLNAEVHFCSKKGFKTILEHNPYIDKLHLLEEDFNGLIANLKAEKFDYIIDLHSNLRTKAIKTKLGVKAFTFNKLNLEKWLLVNLKINKMPNTHIVDRYMETVKSLGVKNDDKGLDYFIPESDEVELDWLPKEYQGGFVTFVIGAQHFTKKLPVHKIIEFCDKINKPILIIGGKEDAKEGEEIEAFFKRTENSESETYLNDQLNKKTIVFNAAGKFNLNQSASLLQQSEKVYTHDTGMMHIAAALKKEVISFWGNTVPEFGMYPYQTKYSIIENKDLGCRPCSKIGFQKCPKGHFNCMNELNLS